MNGSGWGALADGVVRGMQMVSDLETSKQRRKLLDTQQQEADLRLNDRKGQQAYVSGLANLIDQHQRPATAQVGLAAKPTAEASDPNDSTSPPAAHEMTIGENSPALDRSEAPSSAVPPVQASPLFKTGVADGSGGNAVAATPAPVPMPGLASKPVDGPTSPTDRVGFGLFRNPDLLRNPNFMNAAAKLAAQHGVSDQVMPWLQKASQAADENGIDALKSLVGGDYRGAETVFNAGGGMKVVPGSARDAGNGKVQIQLQGEDQLRTIDPKAMLRTFLTPDQFFNAEAKDRTASATERIEGAKADYYASAADLNRGAKSDRMRAQAGEADARAGKADAQADQIASGGGGRPLSMAQETKNYMIDSARRKLTGMSKQDLLKATQQYTATGRENPQYDPQLARAAQLANTRKYGTDHEFDAFGGGGANAAEGHPATEGTADDVTARFSGDPAMKGMRIGQHTPQGYQVTDSAGKLVGYYH